MEAHIGPAPLMLGWSIVAALVGLALIFWPQVRRAWRDLVRLTDGPTAEEEAARYRAAQPPRD